MPLQFGAPQKLRTIFWLSALLVQSDKNCINVAPVTFVAWSPDSYAEDCQFKTDSLQKLSIMSHVIMLLGFDLLALTRSSSVPTLTLNTMRGYMRNVGHVINYHASRD